MIMRGGFVDMHWTILSLAGLVFLGIGDTFVRYYSLIYIGGVWRQTFRDDEVVGLHLEDN